MSQPSWTERPPGTILLASDLSSRCDRVMDRVLLIREPRSVRAPSVKGSAKASARAD